MTVKETYERQVNDAIIPGKPMPSSGELYEMVSPSSLNLVAFGNPEEEEKEGIKAEYLYSLEPGDIVMVVDAYHELWKTKEVGNSDVGNGLVINGYLVLTLLRGEKIAKEIGCSFTEWLANFKEVGKRKRRRRRRDV